MSAALPHRGLAEIETALVGFLGEALWTKSDGSTVAAFEKVAGYDALDFPMALEELVAQKGRVALVIIGDDTWETMDRTMLSPGVTMRRRTAVTILVADRKLGDRQAAIRGDERRPGVWQLAEIAIAACAGSLFIADVQATCAVTKSARVDLAEDATQEGRVAVAVECEVLSDWLDLA